MVKKNFKLFYNLSKRFGDVNHIWFFDIRKAKKYKEIIQLRWKFYFPFYIRCTFHWDIKCWRKWKHKYIFKNPVANIAKRCLDEDAQCISLYPNVVARCRMLSYYENAAVFVVLNILAADKCQVVVLPEHHYLTDL